MLRTWNFQRPENLLSVRIYWSYILVSTKANGFPPWYNTSWTPCWVMENRVNENIQHLWCLPPQKNKKNKWNLSESDTEGMTSDSPSFIVIESLEEVCLAKFSPFLIVKVISSRATPKNVKKMRNKNLLVGVEIRIRQKTLKMKIFHAIKYKAYLHEKLNFPKWVNRSWELDLAKEEEMSAGGYKHKKNNY